MDAVLPVVAHAGEEWLAGGVVVALVIAWVTSRRSGGEDARDRPQD
ncbi:MAG: hypothetical protein ABR575_10010 [Actinomycetota bacterium]